MIKKHIEHLKTKTHAEKSSVAFLYAAILTGLIATVWALAIFSSPTQYFDQQKADTQNLANSGSLFDVLKEGIK
jgi:hypothetical protein